MKRGLWGLFAGVLLVSCSDDSSPVKSTTPEGFVVSGIVRNETGADLTGARVVAWWGVVTGEDYNYFYGEGTVNTEDLTFELVLSEDPPPEALNGSLGVAYLMIVKSSATGMEEPGILPEDYDYGDILGGATRHCVIFSTGANVNGIPWVEEFAPGYSAGRGVEISDYDFEGFEPVDSTTVEIVVDDLESLVFVNWS